MVAKSIADVVLEYVDARANSLKGAMSEQARMDVMEDMIE